MLRVFVASSAALDGSNSRKQYRNFRCMGVIHWRPIITLPIEPALKFAVVGTLLPPVSFK